jgi:hypothetical protein
MAKEAIFAIYLIMYLYFMFCGAITENKKGLFMLL